MEVRISVDEGGPHELYALNRWLTSTEDELRDRVRVIRAPLADGQMVAAVEALSIAVDAEAVGTVLASSLAAWVKNRKNSAKFRIATAERVVTLDFATVDEVIPLLERLYLAR